MLFDTHAHPYLLREYDTDATLRDFFSDNINSLCSIAIDITTSKECVALAQKYPRLYASIGIHPCDVFQYRDTFSETLGNLEKLASENTEHIVAIGECGLDFHWLESLSQKHDVSMETLKDLQYKFFEAQIKFAKKLGLPVVIHSRDSHEEVFEVLQKMQCENFIFHCFSQDLAFASKLIDFAPKCKLGFGGIVTFKNAKDVRETASRIPIKNIIIETDSPYLTPTPYRGKCENSPLYLKHVLDHINELRPEHIEDLTERIYQNSNEIFGL